MQGRQTDNYLNNIFRNMKFVDNIDGFEKVSEGPWEYIDVYAKDHDTVFDGYFQSSKNFFGYYCSSQEFGGSMNVLLDLFKVCELFTNRQNDDGMRQFFFALKEFEELHKEYLDELGVLNLGVEE